jgi:hypothetical protein
MSSAKVTEFEVGTYQNTIGIFLILATTSPQGYFRATWLMEGTQTRYVSCVFYVCGNS